jgi:hypothetical protein
MEQQIRRSPMKKYAKGGVAMGPKKAGKGNAKSGKADQMQSSPRKQMAMKGCK